AMQACGVSLTTVLRPVLLMAVAGWAASQWVLIVAVPWGNQTFREIAWNVIAAKVESEVKPRVFFEEFPNLVLYARDVRPEVGGWSEVFAADSSRPGQPTVFLARPGRMVVDRKARTVELVLENGVQHNAGGTGSAAGDYKANRFDSLTLRLDPEQVFPQTKPSKQEPEMTIAELRVRAEQLRKAHDSPHNAIWYIHQKFSIPVACLVFALIGLGLGVSTSRGGKFAAFALGIGVIFAYYVVMFMAKSMVKGGLLPPPLGPWLPNIVLGAFGLAVLAGRRRWGGLSLQLALPRPLAVALGWVRRRRDGSPPPTGSAGQTTESAGQAAGRSDRVVVVLRVPSLGLPQPGILDMYLARTYLRLLGLTFVSLLGIFYISSFIDLSDKLFKGTTTLDKLLRYFWFATPQFVYYLVPMAALLAALVTIGLLTRNSELIVMKACGISIYRVALPLLAFGAGASVFLFLLENHLLASSNRQAEELKHEIRTGTRRTIDLLNRRWVVGQQGEIYHYEFFDPRRQDLGNLSIYEFAPKEWQLVRRTFAQQTRFERGSAPSGAARGRWTAKQGWVREFSATGDTSNFAIFDKRSLRLEPPAYFGTERPEADRMTYGQLKDHIATMRAAGFNVVPLLVDLQRKIAFPFVTVIMTLIAVPFAVTTGRRGALYGIGVGIVLAMVYWTANNLFAAIGSAGILAPALAAWAPNLLFGAGAAYLLLTVRT
ncbi:MAG: YjgP/YjgQ family permease, partial [Acidobacteria bacterium]